MNTWNWEIQNEEYLKKTIKRCKEKGIILPKFSELKDPSTIKESIKAKLKDIKKEEVHPLNLFRINWKNDYNTGGIGDVNYFEIPKEITGIKARIIGLVGSAFPTGSHKVGATYGCLAPYLVTGRFNPEYHKAVWPSTGNYCRGGVFNSALLAVEAVAILPEEMSKERFDWLKNMGAEIYATTGCESNVKEIYDKCHELEAKSDEYYIFNQFDQFGNSIWHYTVTGAMIEEVYNNVKEENQRLSAYVSATGSAGTIAAGDYLIEKFKNTKVVASEALQCPTILYNGFGAHRIEGIGDKHIPWVHNVKSLDSAVAINDDDPIAIIRLFNEEAGKEYLLSLGVTAEQIEKLSLLGISGISNMLSAIKMAKYYEYTENDIIFTVFTDSMEMYQSRLAEANELLGVYSLKQAEIDWKVSIKNQGVDNFKQLSYNDKKAVHNLKYFTWVEQQGKTAEELNAQWYDENYWHERYNTVEKWDTLIDSFNKEVGILI
ncbi:MAG: pyridoxal-phosphate dependent enzyme [bacterium]